MVIAQTQTLVHILQIIFSSATGMFNTNTVSDITSASLPGKSSKLVA